MFSRIVTFPWFFLENVYTRYTNTHLPRNSFIVERNICKGASVGLGNTMVEIRTGNHVHSEYQVLKYRNVYFGLKKVTEGKTLSYEFVDSVDPYCIMKLEFSRKIHINQGTAPIKVRLSYINHDGTEDIEYDGDFLYTYIPINRYTPDLDKIAMLGAHGCLRGAKALA